MIRVEWNHPRHGRIAETVCPSHEAGLLTALRYLGIGCGGSPTVDRLCDRCARPDQQPREWLPEAAK